MTRSNVITAFEHDTLRVDSQIDDRTFRSLARYHDSVNDAYFDLGYNCIKLRQFVGIIHIDGLTIEVLPKIDRPGYGSSTLFWRTALLEMLAASGILHADILRNALQNVGKTPLFDILTLHFVHAVEIIVHEGLVRKYRGEMGNVSPLKGKILFSQHVNRNLTKPDKWYTEHTVFDRNHAYNGILKCAIDTLYPVCSSVVKERLHAIRLDFIDIPSFLPNSSYMDRLRYDRRTERYRGAIDLAWLVLRDLSPEIKSGRSPVFAIMFDMNKLFERTVLHLLTHEVCSRNDGTVIRGKDSHTFWRRMYLQPDILLQQNSINVIIDTKWKLPENGMPTEQDIRQVFAYGLYFSAPKVVLLYPGNGEENGFNSAFAKIPMLPEIPISCITQYADLVTVTGKLNRDFASKLITNLFCEL